MGEQERGVAIEQKITITSTSWCMSSSFWRYKRHGHTWWISYHRHFIRQLNFFCPFGSSKKTGTLAAWTFELSPQCTLASESATLKEKISTKKQAKVSEGVDRRWVTSDISIQNRAFSEEACFWAGGVWKPGWKLTIFNSVTLLWFVIRSRWGVRIYLRTLKKILQTQIAIVDVTVIFFMFF